MRNATSILEDFVEIYDNWIDIYQKVKLVDLTEVEIRFNNKTIRSFISLYSKTAILRIINIYQQSWNYIGFYDHNLILSDNQTFSDPSSLRCKFSISEIREYMPLLEDSSAFSYIILSSDMMRFILKDKVLDILMIFNSTIKEYIRLSEERSGR